MNYSNIIQDFTWSYSRLTTFEHCPYQFFLSYIKPHSKKRMFFSDYGSFIHSIIEKRLTGQLKQEDLVAYYLMNFRHEVVGIAPSKAIFQSYFNQGLEYLKQMSFPYSTIHAIERKVDFFVGNKQFTGIIDCVAQDGDELIILDNKSRALKPRSGRSIPTKTDLELDEYLRQLYLYSIPFRDEFQRSPNRLEFNCFRTQQIISEAFCDEEFERTKEWALHTIDRITYNEEWSPDMEYWKCKHLCDHNHQCEYYLMNGR